MLFDMTDGSLTKVVPTTFQAEQVLERTHLQAAIMQNIAVLGDDLLVVAEEFGEFEDANRRIDLLCVDKSARLVVVELKRTEAGGHMELQALRYAAMVSTMTFEELVSHYSRHLVRVGDEDSDIDVARERLRQWLDDPVDDELVLQRQVRIVLASTNFSQEITTTVLWLNEFYGLDITCIRLTPYRHEDRLLLDVQQVIPLPEARQLMVKLRKRESEAREARTGGGADWTPYVIISPSGETEPLRKRRAILALIKAMADAEIDLGAMASIVPNRLRMVPGHVDGEELARAFAEVHHRPLQNLGRWFLDEPIHQGGNTWVLSKQWGAQTESVMTALVALAPEKFAFRRA